MSLHETDKPSILFLCRLLRQYLANDAIRKEAYGLFTLMRKAGYSATLVSLETDLTQPEYDDRHGIVYLPEEKLSDVLEAKRPGIVHCFEATLDMYFASDSVLLNYPVIFTASESVPTRALTPQQLGEVRHMTDAGMLTITVCSERAREECIKAGIHPAAVSVVYPGVFTDLQVPSRAMRQPFTVGFASSPLHAGDYHARGVDLLLEAARQCPEVNFLIAWREKNVPFGESLDSLPNVTVRYGTIDMNLFYSEVDALVVPFTTLERNHACPFSVVEALSLGKPVVVTEVVGCAPLIASASFGAVVPSTSEGLVEGIRSLTKGGAARTKRIKDQFSQYFSLDTQEKSYRIVYERSAHVQHVFSISHWDEVLRAAGKYLVRGQEAMAQYYQQQEVAETYAEQRFASPLFAMLNVQEQRAVAILVKAFLNASEKLVLADFAAGEGRILPTLCSLGTCVAVDTSPAMLEQARKHEGVNGLRTVVADAFDVRLEDPVDAITLFRFIRHFQYPDRTVIYETLRANLKPGGIAIIEYTNTAADARDQWGYDRFHIYDVFWTQERIRAEAAANHFTVRALIPVGEYVLEDISLLRQGQPVCWVAALSPEL